MLYSIHPSFWKVISEVIVSIQVFAIIIVGLSFSTAVHVLNFKVQNEILLGVIFAINFNQNQTIQYMYEVEQKKVFVIMHHAQQMFACMKRYSTASQ